MRVVYLLSHPLRRLEDKMNDTILMTIVEKAKVTLRIITPAFDGEITDLVRAAYDELTTRGVIIANDVPPMVLRALLTYVRLHFGQPDDYDRLREAYHEQLGQLMTTTGYTNWGE